MLGYSATVYQAPDVGDANFDRIRKVPYRQVTTYSQTLAAGKLADVPYRAWVDHLLRASGEGHARMLRGGGYPFLFHAQGRDIKKRLRGFQRRSDSRPRRRAVVSRRSLGSELT